MCYQESGGIRSILSINTHCFLFIANSLADFSSSGRVLSLRYEMMEFNYMSMPCLSANVISPSLSLFADWGSVSAAIIHSVSSSALSVDWVWIGLHYSASEFLLTFPGQ